MSRYLAFVIVEKYLDTKELDAQIEDLLSPYYPKKMHGRILYEKSKANEYLKDVVDSWKDAIKRADEKNIESCQKELNKYSAMTPEEYWSELTHAFKEDDFDVLGNVITRTNGYQKFNSYYRSNRCVKLFENITASISDVIGKHYPDVIVTPNCIFYQRYSMSLFSSNKPYYSEQEWKDLAEKIYAKYNNGKYVLTALELFNSIGIIGY